MTDAIDGTEGIVRWRYVWAAMLAIATNLADQPYLANNSVPIN
jgi:hypothetical protein